MATLVLNHRRVRPREHFERFEDGGVYLNEAGRAVVFRAFDEMLERRATAENGCGSRWQMIDTLVCRFVKAVESGAMPEFSKAA